MLSFVYDKSFGFERYVDYLLDVPMYFVVRDGKYIDLTGYSFRDFMKGKVKKGLNLVPNFSDWKLHITTVFSGSKVEKFYRT